MTQPTSPTAAPFEIADIPKYFNPIDSNLIDDDIKEMFRDTSFSAEQMINMQLIKTMKDLVESINNMPDFQFDESGRLITTVRNY